MSQSNGEDDNYSDFLSPTRSPSRTPTGESSTPFFEGDQSSSFKINRHRLSGSWRSARNSFVDRTRRLSDSFDGSSGTGEANAQVHQDDLWAQANHIESASRNRIFFVTCKDFTELCTRMQKTVAKDYAYPIPSLPDPANPGGRRYFIPEEDEPMWFGTSDAHADGTTHTFTFYTHTPLVSGLRCERGWRVRHTATKHVGPGDGTKFASEFKEAAGNVPLLTHSTFDDDDIWGLWKSHGKTGGDVDGRTAVAPHDGRFEIVVSCGDQ